MYKIHTSCRACGCGAPVVSGIKANSTEPLVPAFDLGVQPLANDHCADGEEHAGFAPLKVMFCPRCTLAQLSVVVDPFLLYANYSYVTSHSETMKQHFLAIRQDLMKEQGGNLGRVLEIGSNDGALLLALKNSGGTKDVVGVEPSQFGLQACDKGIRTIRALWSEETALLFSTDPFNTIIARHVFCHVDNWQGFIHGLATASTKDTLVYIEVPYVLDQIERTSFDQIYHEHLSYLSLRAMVALLSDSAFQLHSLHRYPVHGGVIGLCLRRKDYGPPAEDLTQALEAEKSLTIETWMDFKLRAQRQVSRLTNFVSDAVEEGKRVCGYGASAKATVWMNTCGFTKNQISFITDTTSEKLWTTVPGTDIPVVDEGALLRELPDYAICFAWNYAEEILAKEKLAREKGVKFVIPVPELKVV